MKEFLFVFRNDFAAMQGGSPEEMQATMKKWMDWIGGIAAQDKLVDRGSSLILRRGSTGPPPTKPKITFVVINYSMKK